MNDAPAGRDPGDEAEARAARLDALLEKRIVPLLPELAATQAKYRLGCLAGIAVSLALVAGGFAADMIELVSFGFVGLLVAGSALGHFAGLYRDKLRAALTPAVCEAIGGVSHRVGGAHEVVERLRRIPLVASFRNQTIDDVFAGSHDGTAFTLAEVKLFNTVTRTSGTGSKRTTTTKDKIVFKGLTFLVETPEPVRTRVVIRGPMINWFGHRWRQGDSVLEKLGFARIAVPEPGFSRHLTLWAEDQEIALTAVTPGLAATLGRLAATAGWRRIDAGFLGSRFILLLPKRGNAFAAGGLFRPLRRLRDEAHALMEEIMVVHRLIAVLKGKGG